MARRTLLLTGGSGLLGRAVQRLVAERFASQWDVVAPSHAALDVLDATVVASVVAEMAPHALVHTAYVQNGPTARPTIVDGSRHAALAAARAGARLVHLSTDVVFAGRPEPYTEADDRDPVHDYGRAKRDAEDAVTAACPASVLVRTSLLYGDAQSPSVKMVLDGVGGGEPMRFFTDEVRSYAHVDDVALTVLQLLDTDVTGPLHVAGPEPWSRYDFALAVCRTYRVTGSSVVAGLAAELAPSRPRHVVLDSSLAARFVTPPGRVADRLARG